MARPLRSLFSGETADAAPLHHRADTSRKSPAPHYPAHHALFPSAEPLSARFERTSPFPFPPLYLPAHILLYDAEHSTSPGSAATSPPSPHGNPTPPKTNPPPLSVNPPLPPRLAEPPRNPSSPPPPPHSPVTPSPKSLRK